jgi:hypothetical protein
MHFSLCKNRNVFEGCGGLPHVHLWADEAETHDLILCPRLTSKELALAEAELLLKIVIRQEERDGIRERLRSQLEEIDFSIPVPTSPVSRLRRVK